jgi:hypothetical protein
VLVERRKTIYKIDFHVAAQFGKVLFPYSPGFVFLSLLLLLAARQCSASIRTLAGLL